MKTHVVAVLMSGLLCAPRASALENKVAAAEEISVFKVSLVCPAAPQIGCGSAAKPILLELERDANVSEAWLNRAGTKIALVWKAGSNAEARAKMAATLKEDEAIELQGQSRDEALQEFLSRKGWYRGAEVDRLSEEEAGVIAARMVHRVQAKTVLAKDRAEGLERALAEALRQRLTGKTSFEQQPLRLQEIAREYLGKDQMPILQEAMDRGVLPLPNEK